MCAAALIIAAIFAVLAYLIVRGGDTRRKPHRYTGKLAGIELTPVRRDPPPMPKVKPARKPCIGCYGGDLPCVCEHRKPTQTKPGRHADFWSLAEEDDR
jgi:hypothetical protein